MKIMEAFSLARRSLCFPRFLPHNRSFSVLATPAVDDDLKSEVLIEGKASARAVILNRPSALNALTTNMGLRLKKLYESWEDNSDIGFVMMKGSGRAFCAGGDIITLYNLLKEGKAEDCKDFFKHLYTFIYLLGTYLKPHVAILDGITMGGGGGVSIPGTFRAAATTASLAKKYGADITVVVIDDKPKESIPDHESQLSSIRWHLSEGGFSEFRLLERLGEEKKATSVIGEVADDLNLDLVVLSMEAIHSKHVDGNLLAEFIPCPVLLLPL